MGFDNAVACQFSSASGAHRTGYAGYTSVIVGLLPCTFTGNGAPRLYTLSVHRKDRNVNDKITKASSTRIRILAAVAAIAMGAMLPLNSTPAAQAVDSGGNGNPTSCAGAYTVKSAPIYGTRGVTKGKLIGWLELRWSASCKGNWARVVLIGGLYNSPVNVSQFVSSEGRTASANDTFRVPRGGTSAWTPFVRLNNPASTACVEAYVSSDFGTLNYHTVGARFCSH